MTAQKTRINKVLLIGGVATVGVLFLILNHHTPFVSESEANTHKNYRLQFGNSTSKTKGKRSAPTLENDKKSFVPSDRHFTPSLSADDFKTVLMSLKNEDIKNRGEAWRIMKILSIKEKIHWLRHFLKSPDTDIRTCTVKATRLCFGVDNFNRSAKATYNDSRLRQKGNLEQTETAADNALVSTDLSFLPSKRDWVQIGNIVRTALMDSEPSVRNEAILTASSFDVETNNGIFQFAMMSCDDSVRLAILREAEYGDADFMLRLQMAALDVGGEEVVKLAAQGIEKVTGKRFANSDEAFEWYDKNHCVQDATATPEAK